VYSPQVTRGLWGLESPTQVLGLDHKGFANRSVYSVRRCIRLAAGNPSPTPTAPAVPLALAQWLG